MPAGQVAIWKPSTQCASFLPGRSAHARRVRAVARRALHAHACLDQQLALRTLAPLAAAGVGHFERVAASFRPQLLGARQLARSAYVSGILCKNVTASNSSVRSNLSSQLGALVKASGANALVHRARHAQRGVPPPLGTEEEFYVFMQPLPQQTAY